MCRFQRRIRSSRSFYRRGSVEFAKGRDAGRRNARSRALSPRSRRNFISRFRYMFCELARPKEFLLDRGFRVRSKVRNGETANGPSGMICALRTQELQQNRGGGGEDTLPHSHILSLPFPSYLSLFLSWYVQPVHDAPCSVMDANLAIRMISMGWLPEESLVTEKMSHADNYVSVWGERLGGRK